MTCYRRGMVRSIPLTDVRCSPLETRYAQTLNTSTASTRHEKVCELVSVTPDLQEGTAPFN